MRPLKRALLSVLCLLGACLYLEPQPQVVDQPFHNLQDTPKQFTEEVSPPLWPDEIREYIRAKEADGWWLHDQHPAGGSRPSHEVPDAVPSWWVADNFDGSKIRDIPNDPIKHKTILVFRRYGVK
jgi:hypothetical protein